MLDESVKGRMPAPAGNKNKTRIGHGKNVKFNDGVAEVEASRFQLGGDPNKASRFFYCAKASKSERNAGLDRFDCVRIEHDSCEESTAQVISLIKGILESIPNSSIAVSGEGIMVTSPKECTSTIRMAIQQIIESKTLSFSMRSHISESTKDASSSQMDGTSHVECAANLSGSMTTIGTSRDKAGLAMDAVRSAILRKLSNISEENAWKPATNFHATVKPQKLMTYLCRLITPPGGTVLDPFMGSGSTGLACKNLNFQFVGVEIDPEYFQIAKARLKVKSKQPLLWEIELNENQL
jgi:hypothetical protein